MKNYDFEDVYLTLLGEIHPPHAVPGIENAYATGGECDKLYKEAIDAYERLCLRLGVRDEDPDAETIINNLLSIQQILCRKIFHYGQLLRPGWVLREGRLWRISDSQALPKPTSLVTFLFGDKKVTVSLIA